MGRYADKIVTLISQAVASHVSTPFIKGSGSRVIYNRVDLMRSIIRCR